MLADICWLLLLSHFLLYFMCNTDTHILARRLIHACTCVFCCGHVHWCKKRIWFQIFFWRNRIFLIKMWHGSNLNLENGLSYPLYHHNYPLQDTKLCLPPKPYLLVGLLTWWGVCFHLVYMINMIKFGKPHLGFL